MLTKTIKVTIENIRRNYDRHEFIFRSFLFDVLNFKRQCIKRQTNSDLNLYKIKSFINTFISQNFKTNIIF